MVAILYESRVTAAGQDSTYDSSAIVNIPAWIFFFICPFIVGMRIWVRKRTGVGLGADDYTILMALVFAMLTHIIMLRACRHGYGRRLQDLTGAQMYKASQSVYLMQILYKVSIYLTKASIVLLYLRIFGGIKWFRWTCFVLLTFIVSFCTAVTIVTIFQCLPVAAAFDLNITNKKCIDNRHFLYLNAAVSITTDTVVFLIPQPLVFSLHIPRVQKAALVLIFALGIFVVVASCFRLTTIEDQLKSTEPFYEITSTMWTIIEMSVAIVCACLPHVRPLVRMFPTLKSVYNKSKARMSNVRFYRNPRPANGREGRWTRVEYPGGIRLTRISTGDANSRLPLTREDGTSGLVIRKTTEYDIRYSRSKEDSDIPRPLPIM